MSKKNCAGKIFSSIDIINNNYGAIGLMQNTNRWRSDQFQPTHIWNPWSNKTDASLEDSACTVQVLLFLPIQKFRTQPFLAFQHYKTQKERAFTKPINETDQIFRYLSHHLTWHCLLIYGFSQFLTVLVCCDHKIVLH